MDEKIREALTQAREHVVARGDVASDDATVRVTRDGPLRFRAEDPKGNVVLTDMPRGVGGDASAMSPGSLLRSAVGACSASLVVMVAANRAVPLDRLEVDVDSTSDDRGLFGDGDNGPQPLQVRVTYRLASSEASDEDLRAIVAEAEARSPVGQALRRSVEVMTELDLDRGRGT